MTFVIAVNYGSRDEITRAVRKIMADCKDGKIAPEEMTEQVFASYLDTAGDSGSGSHDPHERGTPPFQLSVMAARVLRTLRDRMPVAGLQ